MATINASDILYATIVRQGATLLSLRMSGLTSLSQILAQIRRHLTDAAGLVTLRLRNGSQGWMHQQPLLLSTSAQSVCRL